MVKFHIFLSLALVAVGTSNSVVAQTAAQSTVTLPNWVGPATGTPTDTACYRKSYITTTKKCGAGYTFDNVATCWAQCPIEYPVECGMECIPQNQDCALEIIKKIVSVGTAALNLASSGVFSQISSASKGVQQGVKCGQQVFSVTNKLIGYIKEIETGTKTATTKDQLMFLLSKSDFAVYDLPVAVTTCLGLTVPSGVEVVKPVATVVKTILEKIISSKSTGVNILSPDTFLKFLNDVGVGKSVTSLSTADLDGLKKVISSGVATCGSNVNTVVNKIVATVGDLKKQSPSGTVDVIKFAVLNSNVVLKDLPAAIAGCLNPNSPDAYKIRDQILKTVHAIIDKITEASSQNGKPVSVDQYALTITNLGLDVISRFDPTGLANMAKEFIQPICGPTAYIGQIDDGPADKALGLSTVEKAFSGSSGAWAKKGDGQLRITFKSVDDKDVKVNVLSGGQKLYEIAVKKGQSIVWNKPLSEFQGKTLYMTRSRPGFLGIPSTSGGSFLAWVPDSKDGAMNLSVQLNPTGLFRH